MPSYANTNEEQFDKFNRGLTGAIVLHLVLGAGIVAYTLFAHLLHGPHWGESISQSGSIEASMVSAIPLPPKAPPVKDSVLASEDVTKVPAPTPKVATQPPPKPNEVLIKGKTPEKAVPKPTTVIPPKHPQPTPDTRKANSGDAATQLPQSISQLKNGTSTVTVQDRVFGTRYAYYLQLVGRIVNQNYNPNEADSRASQGKSVTVLFNIERDGTVSDLHIETRSGSTSLDSAAMRAIQHIDSFGPLPAGDHITIEYKFDYHQS
jgi:protein TonB